jgi:hypothetical protein
MRHWGQTLSLDLKVPSIAYQALVLGKNIQEKMTIIRN